MSTCFPSPRSSGGASVWLLDSGASCHMTGDSADFVEYSDLAESIWVTIANGQRLEAKDRGSVRFVLDGGRTVKLTDVLFLPQLGSKLVSVSSLTVHGVVVQFEQHRAVLQVGGTVVATVPKAGKLFEWRVGRAAREEANVAAGDTSVDTSVALWHARLGHVSGAKMKMVASACDGVPEFGTQQLMNRRSAMDALLGR
ncbi:hypothetical protein PsorP6_008913 [Peronosclerospora sorghi]|uniref:Uncharacterized protein n=1 Tax=Peronosclerospora sorghi TaxID=230839 RepID=A0ACC0W240_9STRA|nr:hypothetical protein PsorP6_008913 [Peronosclerospora sorghi]